MAHEQSGSHGGEQREPPRISVVIATYNDGRAIRDAIEPLLSDPAVAELLVVDDGSTDGTYDMLVRRAESEPRLRLFRIANRGQFGATQYGFDRTVHDIVLILDADVVPSEGLASKHQDWHADGVARLVVGYMPVASPSAEASFVARHYSDYYDARAAAYERDPNEIFRGLWGGNISLPRRSLEEAGGPDAGLGLTYHGDFELGFRLAGLGLEPVFDRRLLAEHRFKRSFDGLLSASYKSGRDLVIIAHHHPEAAVPLPPPPRSPLGAVARRLASSRSITPAVTATGKGIARAAMWLGASSAEQRVGLFLGRVHSSVGMRAARRELARSAAPSSIALV